MKVLFFNYEYPPLGAGAANATFCLMHEYSKRPDVEVDVITSSIDKNYHLEKVSESIRIHRLPIGKNKSNLHFQSQKDLLVYSWKAYFFSRKLIDKAKKKGAPYGLTHSFFTVPCGFISMLLKFEYKLPYIISLRGSDVPGYSDRFVFLYKFITPVIKSIWNKAGAVIANSAGLKKLAEKSKPNKEIGIIYNGIDVDIFKPAPEKRPQDKLIITTGATRVTHRKGLNYLIEAVAKLAPRYPKIEARIMGDGNAKTELEEQVRNLKIENKVELIGRIPREEIMPYYEEASVFVMASFNEGMSNAMLEALATGLPIISTPTGGAEELVKDGVNGYLIKYKDSDDIGKKLEILINDQKLREKMGEASRRIAEKMSWQNVAGAYFRLYEKVVDSEK